MHHTHHTHQMSIDNLIYYKAASNVLWGDRCPWSTWPRYSPTRPGAPTQPTNLPRIPMPKVGNVHYPYTAAGKKAAAAARKTKRKTKTKTKSKTK